MRKPALFLCVPVILLLLAGCGDKRIQINALDYIELGQYKGLEVEQMATEISEEDLQKQVDRMLSAFATTEPVNDRKDVQVGDIANIDYEGSIDGVPFEGGAARGFDLEIGSGTFIPGFEEGLVGKETGETVDVDVTFPEEYTNNPNLAGKLAVFQVKINSISKKVLPELTEDFLKEKTGGQFATVDEIRNHLREQTTTSLKEYSESMLHTQLLSKAVDNASLKQDIPAEYLEEKKQAMIRTAKSNAEAYGKTFEDYLQSYLRMDEQTFLSTIDSSASQIAKQGLVVLAIADTENLAVSDEDLQDRINDKMLEYGYQKEKDLFETITKQDIRDELLLEKVTAFLVENAVITEQKETED